MKQLSEHQVGKSLTQVVPVVRQYRDDLNKVLEAFESTHDDKEAIESKQYQVEKARAFDPFGHAGFDPSGKIRMTP